MKKVILHKSHKTLQELFFREGITSRKLTVILGLSRNKVLALVRNPIELRINDLIAISEAYGICLEYLFELTLMSNSQQEIQHKI